MSKDVPKLAHGPGLRAAHKAFHSLALGICISCVFGLLCSSAAGSTEDRGAPLRASGPGAQIAFADFDGDRQLDLATVQTGSSEGTHTIYSVRLRLTAAGRQSMQILGPAGGLEIAARDVNGDHAVDLVLTAAWLKQPVAILLNDGHGNFSSVDPSAYPDAFHDPNSISDGSSPAISLAAASLSQWRAEMNGPAADELSARPITRLSRLADSRFSLARFLTSRSCRAPPARISIL